MTLFRREEQGENMERRFMGCCWEWVTRFRPGVRVALRRRIQRSSFTSKASPLRARSKAKKRKLEGEQVRKWEAIEEV